MWEQEEEQEEKEEEKALAESEEEGSDDEESESDEESMEAMDTEEVNLEVTEGQYLPLISKSIFHGTQERPSSRKTV